MKNLIACLLLLISPLALATPAIGNHGIAFLTNSGSGVSEAITVASGNGLLVMAYGPTGSGTLTLSGGGNTYTGATGNPIQETNNGTQMYVWWVASNATANPTITITMSTSQDSYVVAYEEITGANTSSFVDAQSAIGSPSTGFPTNAAFLSNAVTTTASTDLVVAFAGVASTTNAFSVSGSGWAIKDTIQTGRAAASSFATPGTGATNPTWTNASSAGGGTSFTIAIKASSGAIPPSLFFLSSRSLGDPALNRRGFIHAAVCAALAAAAPFSGARVRGGSVLGIQNPVGGNLAAGGAADFDTTANFNAWLASSGARLPAP